MFRLFVLVGIFALSASHPSRIIGGHDVNISDVPYQLSLQLNGQHICGAVLISSNQALTTAVCVSESKDLTVRAGSTNVNSGGVVVKVSKIDVHPDWSSDSQDNDIAVLTFEKNIELNNDVQPAKLPSADMKVPEKQVLLLAGWGLTDEVNTEVSNTLQAVEMPVISSILCRALYQENYTTNMFCTGRPLGGIGACRGDSGSGLVLNGEVIGLASWGIGCARPNYPDVSSYVPKYRAFIESVTGL